MDVQVTTVRSPNIWKSFLKVPSVTDRKQFLWYWILPSWVLQHIFFSFALTDLWKCVFQLHYHIVIVLIHVCQYCGAYYEQYIKTSIELAGQKLWIPQKVTQSENKMTSWLN